MPFPHPPPASTHLSHEEEEWEWRCGRPFRPLPTKSSSCNNTSCTWDRELDETPHVQTVRSSDSGRSLDRQMTVLLRFTNHPVISVRIHLFHDFNVKEIDVVLGVREEVDSLPFPGHVQSVLSPCPPVQKH